MTHTWIRLPLAMQAVGLAIVLALGLGTARAEGVPVKLMVGFPAGGGTDAIAGGQMAAQALKAAPYRGSAPMVPDFIENHRAGKIRIVATMGPSR